MEPYRIGVDIGGTFTDCAVIDSGGNISVGKSRSTPENFSVGFFDAIDAAARNMGIETGELLGAATRLGHGTTVGINALVTRTGARVGLLTTRGHRDALKIMDNTGRSTGASIEEILHHSRSEMPTQLIDPHLIGEVVERIDYAGEVVVPLDRDQALAAARELVNRGAEVLAVSLLWSFANPQHELEIAELVKSEHPGLFVSLSHEVAPQIGEYPRTAAAVFNAYIGPLMDDYVAQITEGAHRRGFNGQVMFATTTGGLVADTVARQLPILTLQSGPVAGVAATAMIGAQCGFPDAITSDMGGTTLDVSVVRSGRPMLRDSAVIERHQLHLRMVDVESIGAGGGSIAWAPADTRGIRVGPQSAGADPGPACYGRGGTEPTVTDADLILGVLNPDGRLAGGLELDLDAAERAIDSLGSQLGLGRLECAAGIVEIVDARMQDLVRRMTIQRGFDPRDLFLFGYGGGAAAHAGLYGRDLGVKGLVIPLTDVASVWSALGVAVEDVVKVYEAPMFMSEPFDAESIGHMYERLEASAMAELGLMANGKEVRLQRSADMKYGMQVFEVEGIAPEGDPLEDGYVDAMIASFERAYAERFGAGSGYREAGVVLTALRVEARVPAAPPDLRRRELTEGSPERMSVRDVYWRELQGLTATPIYASESLLPGHVMSGPAIVECPDTTIVVRPGQTAAIDAWGNFVVSFQA